MKYLLLLISCYFAVAFAEDYAGNIHFIVYQDNVPHNLSQTATGDPVEEGLCSPEDLLAVVTFGWTESCSTDWVIDLISNLTVYRGGCIICMDYSHYTLSDIYIDYPIVVPLYFNGIVEVLRNEMETYRAIGFDPSNTFMFGMSLGSQVVLHAGRLLEVKISEVDVCDPAQISFPITPDSKESAVNVQCIHTSGDKGTLKRDCHQDWNMGHCGLHQDTVGLNLLDNHGTCPVFYNSAFSNDFKAIDTPSECLVKKVLDVLDLSKKCKDYPAGFKMGYMQRNKQGVCSTSTGTNLFASTSKNYPYNGPNTGLIGGLLGLIGGIL